MRGFPMYSKCIPSAIGNVPPHAKPWRRNTSTIRSSIWGVPPYELVVGLMSSAAPQLWREMFLALVPLAERISRGFQHPPARRVSATLIKAAMPACSISAKTAWSGLTNCRWQLIGPMIAMSARTMFRFTQPGSLSIPAPLVDGSTPRRRSTANSPSSSLREAGESTLSTLFGVHDLSMYFEPTVAAASRATAFVSPPQTITRHVRVSPKDSARAVDISISAVAVRSSSTTAPTGALSDLMGSSHPANVSDVPTDALRSVAAVRLSTRSPRCNALPTSGPSSSAAAAGSSAIAQTG